MTQYRINDLERLTGVKAHTIRIWEKRYMLIEPSRTDTNRRFYSSEQLLKLMNVATLLGQGYKISHLAALTAEELIEHIEKLHNAPSNYAVYAAYVHDLSTAMLTFNEQSFEIVFAAAVAEFGFYDAMLNVFYPFLKKTGMLWRTDKVAPIQEHFALCIIRRKIISAIDGLELVSADARKFILFLPPNEWHEIGLLFSNYLLKAKGYGTVYLGQSVPYEDVALVVTSVNPEFMLTFFISPKPQEEVKEEIENLAQKYPNIKLLISGDKDLLSPITFSEKNIVYLKAVDSLLEIT